MEYGYPEKRKSRGDKRAKARYSKYKQGGKNRTLNVSYAGKEERERINNENSN